MSKCGRPSQCKDHVVYEKLISTGRIDLEVLLALFGVDKIKIQLSFYIILEV